MIRYLPYTLSLRAPALLTSLGGDPNSSRTLPFIPGSALRGAAARGLGPPGDDGERLQRFREVILDGSVRFLNAYPRAGGRRSLPAPVSLRVEKNSAAGSGGELRAWDLAAFTGRPDDDGDAWPGTPLSPLADPFVSLGAAQPLRVTPPRGSRVHQQRDRARGRAWKEEREGREEAHGTVFAFEFLEAGQDFDGILQLRAENEAACNRLIETVRTALDGPLLLGRSRRGGYGGDAAIAWGTVRDREVEGAGIVRADLAADTAFRAILTSPCIVRDPETGQIDPTRVAAEVEERLAGRAKVIARRWTFELVGGFNRKWRLELPQALACSGGSVLVLRTTAPVPFADLSEIEHAGLGERRPEGFGRVMFLEAPTLRLTLRSPPALGPPAPGAGVPELVRFAEARILDAAVARAIDEEAARAARDAKPVPTPSLLGRLRNGLRADPATALGTLRTWLGEEGPLRLKRPAADQLARCRIGDEPLSSWLRSLAAAQDVRPLVSLLRLDALGQRSHVVSEDTARAHWEARADWIRARLIDATLAALARTRRQGRGP